MSKSSRWTDDAWKGYHKTYVADKTVDEICVNNEAKSEFLPKNITMRESRDSDLFPKSTAIIIGVDVTGSMDPVIESLFKDTLPKLASEIYTRKPISDPHIAFAGIGDASQRDAYPLQFTQFEGDIKIAESMKEIFLEKGGGGNNSESYHAPLVFAALMTSIDCFEKRGEKGIIFTMGDEYPPETLSKAHLNKMFLDSQVPMQEITYEQALQMASRMYDVYHIIIEQGSCASYHKKEVYDAWRKILGQNAIRLSDYTKLSEVIVSQLQLRKGENINTVVNSWDGSTSVVVKHALNKDALQKAESGIVTFS